MNRHLRGCILKPEPATTTAAGPPGLLALNPHLSGCPWSPFRPVRQPDSGAVVGEDPEADGVDPGLRHQGAVLLEDTRPMQPLLGVVVSAVQQAAEGPCRVRGDPSSLPASDGAIEIEIGIAIGIEIKTGPAGRIFRAEIGDDSSACYDAPTGLGDRSGLRRSQRSRHAA